MIFMRKKLAIVLAILVIVVVSYGLYYVCDYSHADADATAYLNGTENVSVNKLSNSLFLDGSGNDTALIFYPGAKVEYTSYLPLLMELADKGVDCYIVEMPFNLAFLDMNAADSIINSTDYSHYILAGHSLGGVAASSYVNHSSNVDGLILLAAYPTEKITKPTLSIYGSEDHVLDMKKYTESKPLISNLTEFEIAGGNHAQFACYGNQSGDGAANITYQTQQNQTAGRIMEFINSIK